jgi:hypothetical protein
MGTLAVVPGAIENAADEPPTARLPMHIRSDRRQAIWNVPRPSAASAVG